MKITKCAWLMIFLQSALINCLPVEAATVWSGYEFSFSKPDGVDSLLPEWQDEITSAVVITRVNSGGGLVNALEEVVDDELVFDRLVSPVGTLWAYPFNNNPGATIAASNWSNLAFHPWATAFGGNGNGGPPGVIGLPSVMYSVADDLYIDVRLTGWTVRTGGGFSYERALAPTLLGDFNSDTFVNGLDFLIWQRGESPTPFNAVDLADWQANYGTGGLVAASTAVPEPGTIALLMVGLLVSFRRGCYAR
ncbi:MAG: PEP-CTERM sorting domain-containing protein [Bythopirellula sp.]|nr:PEP-CTERM sorting domain-containing protein [Bythopirellula sp.]